ncbi:hypothetical protein LEMLEM_LOCUS3868 [Lemmus lemmus]
MIQHLQCIELCDRWLYHLALPRYKFLLWERSAGSILEKRRKSV